MISGDVNLFLVTRTECFVTDKAGVGQSLNVSLYVLCHVLLQFLRVATNLTIVDSVLMSAQMFLNNFLCC